MYRRPINADQMWKLIMYIHLSNNFFSETIHTVNGLLFGVGDNVSDESSVDAENVRNEALPVESTTSRDAKYPKTTYMSPNNGHPMKHQSGWVAKRRCQGCYDTDDG
jgi:hypothetical protein